MYRKQESNHLEWLEHTPSFLLSLAIWLFSLTAFFFGSLNVQFTEIILTFLLAFLPTRHVSLPVLSCFYCDHLEVNMDGSFY